MPKSYIIVQLKEDGKEDDARERVVLVSRSLFESLNPDGVLVTRDVNRGTYVSVRKREVVFVREETG